MASVVVHPAARVHGRLAVPGDKSISHRYALLAAMADGSDSPKGPYTVTGNTLVAREELHPDQVKEFGEACRLLLDAPDDTAVIDLREVRYVYSSYVGIIGNFAHAHEHLEAACLIGIVRKPRAVR